MSRTRKLIKSRRADSGISQMKRNGVLHLIDRYLYCMNHVTRPECAAQYHGFTIIYSSRPSDIPS